MCVRDHVYANHKFMNSLSFFLYEHAVENTIIYMNLFYLFGWTYGHFLIRLNSWFNIIDLMYEETDTQLKIQIQFCIIPKQVIRGRKSGGRKRNHRISSHSIETRAFLMRLTEIAERLQEWEWKRNTIYVCRGVEEGKKAVRKGCMIRMTVRDVSQALIFSHK